MALMVTGASRPHSPKELTLSNALTVVNQHLQVPAVRLIEPSTSTYLNIAADLFNYFSADSTDRNLAIWNYTAGWFQVETGPDTSTVLLPDDPDQSRYALINHCRRDTLLDVLPSLIFKRSFHSYVPDTFAANMSRPCRFSITWHDHCFGGTR